MTAAATHTRSKVCMLPHHTHTHRRRRGMRCDNVNLPSLVNVCLLRQQTHVAYLAHRLASIRVCVAAT